MKLTFKSSLIICVLSSILFSGCNSGMFKKPDLNRLAFWKNENLRLAAKKDDVPPPSLHFAPDPGEGSNTKADMKNNIEQIIAEAKKSKNNSLASDDKPIRKPYSLDTLNPKIGDQQKTESNDFAISKRINKIQNATNQAIKTTDNAFKAAGSAVKNTANTFSGLKNSAQSRIANASNEFKSQAKTAIENTNSSVQEFAKNTEDTINKTISGVSNSLDNSFNSPNVIANPFAKGSATKSSLSPMVNQNETKSQDFVSKYKQAAQQLKGSQASAITNAIKQSSFNADIGKENTSSQSVSNPLKPAKGQSTPTKYPSTSFGKFKPLKQDNEEEDAFKIPPQLLRGNGSFSPGSTKPLRPVTSNQ